MSGNDQLREQLDAVRKGLRAFDHPAVEEVAGLRLMQETLRERESHIANQIRKNETCSIELVLKADTAAASVPVVTGILNALAAGIAAAGTQRSETLEPAARPDLGVALVPHLAEISVDGDEVTVSLTRPPGSLGSQPVDPRSEAPLFEHAAVDCIEALRTASSTDDAAVSAGILQSLCPLTDVLIGSGSVLRITVEPFVLDQVEVSINQAAAQRVALRCAKD